MSKFKFLKNKKKQANTNSDDKSLVSDCKNPDNSEAPELNEEIIEAAAPPDRFKFLKEKIRSEAAQDGNEQNNPGVAPTSPPVAETPPDELPSEPEEPEKPSIIPGSDGEHRLQEKFGSKDRALNFYDRQMLDYLSPLMQEFIKRQEFLFVATADRNGECDCTSKFGTPGFIRVLSSKYLMYPEFRGNGVYANSGNITENPHIALLIIDFIQDTVGLHVNGKVRAVENDELHEYAEQLPEDVIEEINQEGKKCPEHWMIVEVEEAYIQCSKHIPAMKKMDKNIDWGTDNVAAKGGDYFQLQSIPLYDRVGGDKTMEIAVDLFYRKVLQDDLVSKFFEDVDMEGQRLKQKSFLSMAFGGPYKYTSQDLRKTHKHLVDEMGLSDEHFDRVAAIFQEALEELGVSKNELKGMMEIIGSTRDEILNR